MTRDEALRILGLEPNATLDDVKKAYRDLVKVTHPDKDATAGAKQRFILIQDAYEMITKAEKERHERQARARAEREQGEREEREHAEKMRREKERKEREAKEREEKIRREKERKEREEQERKEKARREVEAYVFSCLERGVKKVTKLKQYGAAIRDFDDALTHEGSWYSDRSKTLKRCLSDVHCWRGVALYYIIQDNPMSREDPYNSHELRGLIGYKNIIEDFDKAIRLRPDNSGAYYWRGRMKYENARIKHWEDRVTCEYDTGAYESIVHDFDKAISLTTDHADAYYWRGRVKCGRVVFNAISESGNRDKGYYERTVTIGHVQRKGYIGTEPKEVKMMSVFNAAVQDFNEAIRLRSNCVEVYYWRGIANYFLEQYEGAVQDFDEVIRMNPNHASAYNWRGNAKIGLKQNDAARLDYEKANALAAETNMTFDSWVEQQ